MFSSLDVEDKNALAVVPVEHATGRFHDLSVPGALELWSSWGMEPLSGKFSELPYVTKDSLDQLSSRVEIVEGDVIGDGFQVAERRLGPDQLDQVIHRARRCFASS